MSNPLITTRKFAALSLALGVTAIVHLGVWHCAAANALQVARDSRAGTAAQADQAARAAPAVTITAQRSPATRPVTAT